MSKWSTNSGGLRKATILCRKFAEKLTTNTSLAYNLLHQRRQQKSKLSCQVTSRNCSSSKFIRPALSFGWNLPLARYAPAPKGYAITTQRNNPNRNGDECKDSPIRLLGPILSLEEPEQNVGTSLKSTAPTQTDKVIGIWRDDEQCWAVSIKPVKPPLIVPSFFHLPSLQPSANKTPLFAEEVICLARNFFHDFPWHFLEVRWSLKTLLHFWQTCALQPEESLPLSKDRPFQQKRNVILSLIFRPGKFLLDHTSILSSRLMYSQMREDWRGLSFNRAEWPIACQSEILL